MRFKALVIILGLENFMLPCFTKQIIGIDCPGCGLQRSALFLLKGEFWNAFHMYPAIYPMLLLPLVENSFKYSMQEDFENTFINIKLTQKPEAFIFYIENNCTKNVSELPNEYSGVGIETIRKNLEIVYPKKHVLNLTKSENAFSVTLKLF